MDIDSTPANSDQIEVTLLGPGYGECCVVHLGSNNWIIIDSCISNSGEPISIEYLKGLGVDPGSAVSHVFATHWHDDHIRGMASTIRQCHSAEFCCSSALGSREFLAATAPYEERLNFAGGSGVSEIFGVLEELRAGPRSRPIHALADRRVIALKAAELAHHTNVEVWTLSPSDTQFRNFLSDISRLVPEIRQTKSRFPSPRSNDLSVVILISIGDMSVLLGADLEETGGKTVGWSAILSSKARPMTKASVFKIAHHGSKTGHCPEVWTEMLEKKPIALTTPYRSGRFNLPTPNDVDRILSLAGEFYLTSVGGRSSLPRRSATVEKMIRQVGQITSLTVPIGTVRVRNGGMGNPRLWTTEVSKEARRITARSGP